MIKRSRVLPAFCPCVVIGNMIGENNFGWINTCRKAVDSLRNKKTRIVSFDDDIKKTIPKKTTPKKTKRVRSSRDQYNETLLKMLLIEHDEEWAQINQEDESLKVRIGDILETILEDEGDGYYEENVESRRYSAYAI